MKQMSRPGRELGQFGGAVFGAIRAGLQSGPCRSLTREEIEALQAAGQVSEPGPAPSLRDRIRPFAW